LEDFIYVLDYHLTINEQVANADDLVKPYLMDAFRFLLNHPTRDEIIEAQLIPSIAEMRRELIIRKLTVLTTS